MTLDLEDKGTWVRGAEACPMDGEFTLQSWLEGILDGKRIGPAAIRMTFAVGGTVEVIDYGDSDLLDLADAKDLDSSDFDDVDPIAALASWHRQHRR